MNAQGERVLDEYLERLERSLSDVPSARRDEIVSEIEGTEVLIDDQPLPYARELWLPLVWFLIR